MKKYLPWLIVIGVIIAGATAWYVYGVRVATVQSGANCTAQGTCVTIEGTSLSG